MFPDKQYTVRAIVVVREGDRNKFVSKITQCSSLEEVKQFSRSINRSVQIYDNEKHVGWLRVDNCKGKEMIRHGPCTAHKGKGETECICLFGS